MRRDVRVYLTGPLCLESGERLLRAGPARAAGPPPARLSRRRARPAAVPGRARRRALAGRAAGRLGGLAEVADQQDPGGAEPGSGLPGAELIRGAFGAYQFRLPPGGWVDVDAAALAVHLAEAALARPAIPAWRPARRSSPGSSPPGRSCPAWRGPGRTAGGGACTSSGSARWRPWPALISQRGQLATAIQGAELVLGLDELRESSWRILMRAHAAGRATPAPRCAATNAAAGRWTSSSAPSRRPAPGPRTAS